MSFSDPEHNISQLGITEGARVADLGSGSGFYTVAAARRAGADGRVYAVDIQQDLLTRVADEAKNERLSNVEIIRGDLEHVGGSRVADASVNVVIVANILFQLESKDAIAKEANRILRPGGRVLVVDWTDSFSGLGPPPEHIVAETTARRIFEGNGFIPDKDIDAGAHHYGFIMRKPTRQ